MNVYCKNPKWTFKLILLSTIILSCSQKRGNEIEWALMLEKNPNPEIIVDEEVRRKILVTNLPWKVKHKKSGVEFVLIPPGRYLRGAAADDPYYGERVNELPQHSVTIANPFYLSTYEITNAQFRQFRPEHNSGLFFRGDSLNLNQDSMPVGDVSWDDCKAFCDYFDFRLPTDAEWEYAARAGVKMRYPWGNDIDKGHGYGNVFNEAVKEVIPDMDWEAFSWHDGYLVSSPVGSFRPNGFGLYDMFGNVWEWVEDAYSEEEYITYINGVTDPVNRNGERRSLRGGGYGNAPRGSGIPYRFGMLPNERFDGNGFRVVIDVGG